MHRYNTHTRPMHPHPCTCYRLRVIVIFDGFVHPGIRAISAGDYHSMVLGYDGSVWATGWNLWGTLGDDSITDRTVFVEVLPYGQCSGLASVDSQTIPSMTHWHHASTRLCYKSLCTRSTHSTYVGGLWNFRPHTHFFYHTVSYIHTHTSSHLHAGTLTLI